MDLYRGAYLCRSTPIRMPPLPHIDIESSYGGETQGDTRRHEGTGGDSRRLGETG